MIHVEDAFSGFTVKDLKKAKKFYEETLGFKVDEDGRGLSIHLSGKATIFVYEQKDREPAGYTILNIPVDDIDDSFEELSKKGVKFLTYEGMTDEKGINRGRMQGYGPDIAWFEDPSGNIISILN